LPLRFARKAVGAKPFVAARIEASLRSLASAVRLGLKVSGWGLRVWGLRV